MRENQFIQSLQYLSPKELADFSLHLKSQRPRAKVIRTVFNYIRKLYPDFQSTKHLSLSYASDKLLGPNANRKRLLNILAELNALLKDFFVWQKVKSQDFVYEYALLEQYKERQMDKAFFQLSQQMIKKYETQSTHSIWHYLQMMMLYRSRFFHPNSPKLDPRDSLPQQSLSFLNQFYEGARLRLATELLNRQKILSATPTDLAKVPDNALPAPSLNNPLIALYQQVYQLEKEQEEKVYFSLKTHFFELLELQSLSIDDQYFVFLHLINFTSSQIKRGHSVFLQEAFDIYQKGMQYQFLVQGMFFTPTNFSNIVNIACRLQRFEWATYFIQAYQIHLPTNVRESATQISFAMIHFEQGEFEKTLEHLQNLAYADTFYELRARALRLRCYLELKESISLILHYCRSFEQFIRRNRRIKGNNAAASFHFIQLIKYLVRRKIKKEEIQAYLDQAQPLFFKTWLQEKINMYKPIQ